MKRSVFESGASKALRNGGAPKILIDSYGWIEYFRREGNAEKYSRYIEAAHPSTHITPSVVLYEVYKKIKATDDESTALEKVGKIIDTTSVVNIDQEIALNAAEISLAAKLPMADAMIKAIAELTDVKIVSGDPHFKGMNNVIFVE